mgnify:FL=1
MWVKQKTENWHNRKAVPACRGQLTFPVLIFLGEKSFTTSRKRNSPLPSFLSGRQIRNDNRRKEYNMTLSEESGIGYRKTHLTPTFFAQILHSTPYFFILLFPTAFYDRSRMTGSFLIPFCKKLFYLSAHTCPFRQPAGWHFPRQAGAAYVYYSFLLRQKVIQYHTGTQFTRAVILERRAESE